MTDINDSNSNLHSTLVSDSSVYGQTWNRRVGHGLCSHLEFSQRRKKPAENQVVEWVRPRKTAAADDGNKVSAGGKRAENDCSWHQQPPPESWDDGIASFQLDDHKSRLYRALRAGWNWPRSTKTPGQSFMEG